MSLLHWAADLDYSDVVILLLEKGARNNIMDKVCSKVGYLELELQFFSLIFLDIITKFIWRFDGTYIVISLTRDHSLFCESVHV